MQWPWWKEFHSFWRELPNYNPIGVTSSAPGIDHVTSASSLFDPTPSDNVEDDKASAAGPDEEQDKIDSSDESEVDKEEEETKPEGSDDDNKVAVKVVCLLSLFQNLHLS